MTNKRLGQMLVESGHITGEQLIRAIQSQRALGGRLGTCLLEMDVLTEDKLLDALSHQLRVPAAHIDQLRGIDDEILGLIPARIALRCQAIPFFASNTDLLVATLDVRDLGLLDELAFCSNRRIRPHIANEVRIFEALEKYYGHEIPPRFGHLLDRLNRSRYMWDESAKILLGASAEEPVQWQGLEALEAGWAEEKRLIRPAASRSSRALGRSSAPGRPSSPAIASSVAAPTPQPMATPPAPAPPSMPATSAAMNAVAASTAAAVPVPTIPMPTIPAPLVAPEPVLADAAPKDAEPFPASSQPGYRPLTLQEVDAQLAIEPDRQKIGEILLAYLGQKFSRCAVLTVRKNLVKGWLARGEGFDIRQFQGLELPLDQPSALLNLQNGSDLFVGPLAPMPTHRLLARAWGGELPKDCVMIPLRIRERMVCVLYGDCGARGVGGVDLESLRRLTEKASHALELCILRKKLQRL